MGVEIENHAYDLLCDWETAVVVACDLPELKSDFTAVDWDAARALARDGIDMESFCDVIRYGMRDSFSRPRVSGSFAAAAKCYPGLASKFDAAVRVPCGDCHEEYPLTDDEARTQGPLGSRYYAQCPGCAWDLARAIEKAEAEAVEHVASVAATNGHVGAEEPEEDDLPW